MKVVYLNPLQQITEELKNKYPDLNWNLPPLEPTHFAVETDEELNDLLKTIRETNRE